MWSARKGGKSAVKVPLAHIPTFPASRHRFADAVTSVAYEKEAMIGSLIVAIAAFACGAQSAFVVPPSSTPPTNYQKWAHYHWVWLKNDLGNQANETALIQGYKDINVPVGALNIDSEWATQFNNFVVDTNKFPDFKGLVDQMHNDGIKVILW